MNGCFERSTNGERVLPPISEAVKSVGFPKPVDFSLLKDSNFTTLSVINHLSRQIQAIHSDSITNGKPICKSPWIPVPVPKKSFVQVAFDVISKKKSDIWAIDGVSGRKITYSQLGIDSLIVSRSLLELGLQAGDIVNLCIGNSIEFGILTLAIAINGAISNPTNPASTFSELKHQVEESKPKIIICCESNLKTVLDVADVCGSIKKVIALKTNALNNGKLPQHAKCISYDSLLVIKPIGSQINGKQRINNIKSSSSSAPLPEVSLGGTKTDEKDAELPMLLFYSSGTTGLPKGILTAGSAILSEIYQHISIIPGKDVVLGVLPFYYTFGMVFVLLGSLIRGLTLVILPRFKPELCLSAIEKFKVTTMPLVPPIAIGCLDCYNFEKPNYDVSSLKRIIGGATQIKHDLVERLIKIFKLHSIQQCYGMTETLGVLWTPVKNKPSSAGRPMPTVEIKVVDIDSGKPLGVNQRGELCVKGAQRMLRYLKPEVDTNLIDSEGWVHTGDIAYFDEDGFFFLVDRKKDLIKFKGCQVSPLEIEQVLLSHEDVQDAAVVGLPDRLAGELPTAFVVTKSGKTISLSDMQKFASKKLSAHKQLRGGIHLIGQIPRSSQGKVLRTKLRELLTDGSIVPKPTTNP